MQVVFSNLNINRCDWLAVVNVYTVFLPSSVQYFFSSESSTAIQWISSSDKHLLVLIANLVAEFKDSRNVEQWIFVPGQINSADIGTRGIKKSELENTDWLRGPFFLTLEKSMLPEKPHFVVSGSSSSVCFKNSLPKLALGELFRKVCSFGKLKPIVALVFKLRPAQHRIEKSSNLVLTVDDFARVGMVSTICSQVHLGSFPTVFPRVFPSCASPLIMLFPVILKWHLLSHF